MEADLILIAASEPVLTDALATELRLGGYRTVEAHASRQLLLMLAGQAPAALVLSDLPDLPSSLRLLRRLRDGRDTPAGANPAVPVLVRSAFDGQLCELMALDAGADDFRALPASPGVLRARVARLIARATAPVATDRLQVGRLLVDLPSRTVRYAGEPVPCRRLEFDLLARLAAEPTRAISTAELLADVWDWHGALDTRTAHSTAYRLRRKLAAVGAIGYVTNVWGQGYRLLPLAMLP